MGNPVSSQKYGGKNGLAQLQNVQKLAGAGSSQTDAAQITTKCPVTVWATGADGSVGIKLPAGVIGKRVTVVNDDAANAILKVYPFEATGVINALSAGAAISMAAKTRADFICIEDAVRNGGTVTWATLPLLPS